MCAWMRFGEEIRWQLVLSCVGSSLFHDTLEATFTYLDIPKSSYPPLLLTVHAIAALPGHLGELHLG